MGLWLGCPDFPLVIAGESKGMLVLLVTFISFIPQSPQSFSCANGCSVRSVLGAASRSAAGVYTAHDINLMTASQEAPATDNPCRVYPPTVEEDYSLPLGGCLSPPTVDLSDVPDCLCINAKKGCRRAAAPLQGCTQAIPARYPRG